MIRLAVRVRREHAEVVLAELLELVPAGVEEVQLGETIEYAVYGAPGELPGVPDLTAVAGEALVAISTSEILDDWQRRWKGFHRPVLIPAPAGSAPGVPSLRIRPPWERPGARRPRELAEIVIDPGQAFGTGGHPTTRLCLELLLELAAREGSGGPLLDVGTGSGVLAIAARRLGFGPVCALDNDRQSVDAARQNARVNGVDIEVRRFDLRTEPLLGADPHPGPARSTVVLANLLRPLLLELERALSGAPAHLLAGGLLVREVDEIVAAFAARLNLRERERRHSGEWAAVWLSAP